MSSLINHHNVFSDIEGLRIKCSEHSEGTSVTQKDDGLPDWQLKNGRLINTTANYFSIGLYLEKEGTPCLMMEQPEKALIMLLKSTIDGQSVVLLSGR